MENEGSPRLKRIFGALLLAASGLAVHGALAAGPKITVNIPAGNAVNTLLEFYLQSRVQVLYLSQAVQDIETNAVSGEYEASEALDQMLEGTGLVFEFESEFTAVVHIQADSDAQQTASAEPSHAVTPLTQGQSQNVITPPGGVGNISEMVVTGSYIRGVLDLMSPLKIVTKNEMKQTAYATVQDAMQMLPFNAGAVQGEDFAGTGNFNRGSAINLRGLGAGATLVLVNGRRQAQAGLQAEFVDVSNVPWSVVERIEVLPDGTSALYGSDAIAGVANIILRKELDGAESQVRFGTAPDGAAETVAAQLFGSSWESGNLLAAYQYSERTSLAAADRIYTANSDKRSLGGRNHSSFRSNPGNILDPRTFGPIFAIPGNQDGTSLTSANLLAGSINWQNTFSQVNLLPDKEMHSAYLTASQRIGERFNIFAEARYSQREMQSRGTADRQLLFVPAANPFFVDPFGGSPFVVVAYDFLADLGPNIGRGDTQNMSAAAGVTATIRDSWQATLAISDARERMRYLGQNTTNPGALSAALADPNPNTAFNPFGDGSHTNPATLEAIRYVQRNRAESRIDTVNFIADGSFLSLPWGMAKLAFGAEHREETLERRLRGRDQSNPLQRLDRDIDAVFSELSMPVIGRADDPRAVPRLEFSLAGRYERYSDFGNTFNPKIGLRWVPIDSVKVRASWGTSFKAPKLVDLYDTSQNGAGPIVFPDPISPTGQSTVLLHLGSNPNLHEETATTWTAGLDLTPRGIPGLVMSFTGYAIQYDDQVVQPGGLSLFSILLQESQWLPAITRNPSQAQIDAFCSHPDIFVPFSQCRATAPTALIDARLRNLATIQTQGLDVNLSYSLSTRLGHFSSNLEASRIFSFKQAFTKTSPEVDIVDTAHNPLALRLRSGIEWNQQGLNEAGLGVNLTANHTGRYRNPNSPIRPMIDAWTSFDLRLRYQTNRGSRWWDNVELNLNAINLFDKDPSFVDDEWGYDYISIEPMGRVISLYVQKKW